MDTFSREDLRKKYGDERVLVVPQKVAQNIPDKFSPTRTTGLYTHQIAPYHQFVLRADAEANYALLQVIPYTLITRPNGDFFAAERVKGDKRLVGKLSLGFGGHVNPEDDKGSILITAAQRELSEELKLGFKSMRSELQVIGYLQDKTSNTRDHFGVVYKLVVSSASIREKDALKGKWMSLKKLVDNYSLFEGWSQYLVDYLFDSSKKEAI